MKNIWLCGLLVAGVVLLGCGQGKSPGVIKLGIAGPMTGNDAKMGNDVKHGAEIAVAEWNAKGGVLGKHITAITKDDEAKEHSSLCSLRFDK